MARKIKTYTARYGWLDKNGIYQREEDGGFHEYELEAVAQRVVETIRAEGGYIDLEDVEFTERIVFFEK